MWRYTYFYISFFHFFVFSCFYEGLPAYDFSWEPFYFFAKTGFIFMFRPHHITPLLNYPFYVTYNTLNCLLFTLSIFPTLTLCCVFLKISSFMVPFFVQRVFGKGMGKQKKRQDKDQPLFINGTSLFPCICFFLFFIFLFCSLYWYHFVISSWRLFVLIAAFYTIVFLFLFSFFKFF